MQIFGKLNNKYKVIVIFALTLGIFIPIIYLLRDVFNWLSLFLAVPLFLSAIIYLATHKNISIPYLAPLLTRHYFKTKFRITDLENSLNKTNKLGRILKLFLYSGFLRFLYFLILLFKNSQDSFSEVREEIQKSYREVAVINSSYDTIFDFKCIQEKIQNGEEVDTDILVEYYQKLFDLHKKQQKKAAHYSIATLGLIVLATVIAGTITSLIFNKTPNIFAATYDFVQSSWAGGVSGTTATHVSDQSCWTYYSTSTAGISAGANISVATSSFWFTDDGTTSTSTPDNYATGGDFNDGTTASTTVSGGGSGASVKLAFVGPGDYDMIIGDSSGVAYGYENTGTVSSPTWTAKTAWNLPDIGAEAAPTLADLDNDGDFDLMVGESVGQCYGYQNTGTVSSPVWARKAAWDTVDVGSYASPTLADL